MTTLTATGRRRAHPEEESYFVSMTDMMVGLVFVLIVMLVYFALQFHRTTVELTDTKVRRTELLEHIQRQLKAENLNVAIDTDAGVIRLPEDVLFAKGSSEVTPQGQAALAKVGRALQADLPCFTSPSPPPGCPQTASGVESVFIEGHSDSDPLTGGRDNWNLSTDRAVNTYRSLIAATPALSDIKDARLRTGAPPQPILGVSGYGPTRPLVAETSEAAKAQNRRIDIRVLMATNDVNAHD